MKSACLGLVLGITGLVAAGCGTGGTDSQMVYIAQQADFAAYVSWESFALGVAMNSGHPVGDEVGYRNMKPMGGAYPVGTILVKEIHTGTTPQEWQLFGMMKRGGGYNGGGARDWEFATLALDVDSVPIIITRGANPADGGDSSGHGYAASVDGVTCNRCHGIAGTEATDHVLDSFMTP